jgi:RNA polymerase sigma factor (TIGR02999 family)
MLLGRLLLFTNNCGNCPENGFKVFQQSEEWSIVLGWPAFSRLVSGLQASFDLLGSNAARQRLPTRFAWAQKFGRTLTRRCDGAILALIPSCGRNVSQRPSQPISELLVRWKGGDQQALESLVPFVYKELREIARRHLLRERHGHTLQSAALVHEAYLRLVDQKPFDTDNRVHFFAVASRLMRQILVDYARSHDAAKRGADLKVELDPALVVSLERSSDLVALDDALSELSRLDEQQAGIVEMRFLEACRSRRSATCSASPVRP